MVGREAGRGRDTVEGVEGAAQWREKGGGGRRGRSIGREERSGGVVGGGAVQGREEGGGDGRGKGRGTEGGVKVGWDMGRG